MPLLGYAQWRQFQDAAERAQLACANSGWEAHHHFAGVRKVMNAGRSGASTVEDYHLTRYACYLVAMNSDPRKVAVSAAQTYFALKAQEAEEARAVRTDSASSLEGSAAVLALLTAIAGKLDTVIALLDQAHAQTPDRPLLLSDEQEPLERFLAACCVASPGSRVRASQLYEAYVSWAFAHHLEPISPNAFGSAMKHRFVCKRASWGVAYCGLSLL